MFDAVMHEVMLKSGCALAETEYGRRGSRKQNGVLPGRPFR